jgi:serine/threonine protein kinase/Leucine-rich repeat (LRR) protein
MSERRPDAISPNAPDPTREQTSPPQTHEFSVDSTNPSFGSLVPGGVPGYSFLSPPQTPDEIGRLGDYRILAKLGEGGMGFVFRAEETALRRPVALKVMRPEVAAKPQAAERFLREGRAAAALKSDHIITIYRADSANGVPYLAMEFLEGMPLDVWMKSQKKPIPLSHALRIVRDTLRGLASAHDKGLIHRDIKPANLWLEKANSRVKLLDFGLTRNNEADMQLTQEGAVVGTPAYMAPEQASGKPVDPRADLFSVGVLMYHLLAGKNPFARSSLMETLGAIGYEVQPPLISVRAEVAREYSDYVDRLLAKLPEGRPAHARAALAEIAGIEKRLQAGGQTLAPAASIVAIPVPESVPDAAPQVWGELDFDSAPTERSAIARSGVAPPSVTRNNRSVLYYGVGIAMFLIALVGITLALSGGGKTNPGAGSPDSAKANEPKKDGKSSTGVGKKAAPKVTLDPDRKAAEFVLSNGGTLTIADRNYEPKDADTLPTEPFKIQSILMNVREITDSEAELLFNVDGLKTLGILYKMTDRNLAKLSKLPAAQSLKTFHADIPELTDAGLKLFRNFTAIQDLRLNEVRCSGAGFRDWAGWELPALLLRLQPGFVEDNLKLLKDTKITNITLIANEAGPAVTEAGFRHLGEIRSLTEINLYSTPVTDGCIVAFESLPNLQYLRIQNSTVPTVTRNCLTSVAKMKSLRCLVLDLPLRDTDLRTLLSHENLSEFMFTGANPEFTDAGLESLTSLKSLSSLGVNGSRATAEGVRKFKAARPTVNLLGDLLTLADPDRAAAEFVISRKGYATIQSQGATTNITDTANLPASAFKLIDFHVMAEDSAITDTDLDRFRELTELQLLAISGRFTDAGLAKLPQYRSAAILRRVAIISPEPTDAAFASLAKLPALASLDLIDLKSFTGRGFADLKGSGLTWLLIRNCQSLQSAELVHLAGLPKLTSLIFERATLSDEALRHIGTMTQLKQLSLNEIEGITDSGGRHLEGLNSLEDLACASKPFGEESFVSIAKLPRIKKLNVNGSKKFTAKAAKALAMAPALQTIFLSDSTLDDEGLAALTDCKTLKELHAHQSKITAAGAAAFRKARPDVLLQCDFPDDTVRKAVETLVGLGALVVIRIDGEETAVRNLDDVAGKTFEVVSVNTNRNKNVNDDVLECLRGLRHLTSAQLTNCAAGDRALECLKGSTKLETLILYNSKITDKGLEHLAVLTNLKNLNITQLPNLSEAAVKALAAKIPQCRIAWNGGSIEPTK